MSTIVKNVGPIATGPQNQQDTKSVGGRGDQGRVTMTLRGLHFTWGPNESKTLADDLAAEAVANDSRLRIADSRDGAFTAGRS